MATALHSPAAVPDCEPASSTMAGAHDPFLPASALHKLSASTSTTYRVKRLVRRQWPVLIFGLALLAAAAWILRSNSASPRASFADRFAKLVAPSSDIPAAPADAHGMTVEVATQRLLMHPPPASSAFRFFEREPGNYGHIIRGSAPRDPPLKRKMGLLAMTVGATTPAMVVRRVLNAFDSAAFDVMLFHTDDNYAHVWSKVPGYERWTAVHATGQSKWWFAKRFLTPMVVENYDFVLLWDDDAVLKGDWAPDHFVALLKSLDVHFAHPDMVALGENDAQAANANDDEDAQPTTSINGSATTRASSEPVPSPTHSASAKTTKVTAASSTKSTPNSGMFTTRIGTSFPVFSRAAWPCAWRLLSYSGASNAAAWYPTCAAHGLCRFASISSFPVGRRSEEEAPQEESGDAHMQMLCGALQASTTAGTADTASVPFYHVADTIDVPRLPSPSLARAAREAKREREKKLEELAHKMHITVPELLDELDETNNGTAAEARPDTASVTAPLDIAPWRGSARVRAMCATWSNPPHVSLRVIPANETEAAKHKCPDRRWKKIRNLPWWADQVQSPADARAVGAPPERMGFVMAREREMARMRALKGLIDEERRRMREMGGMAKWYGAPYGTR
ncbi:hypothetical protein AMAG_02625 [Allomyces macrogynus ATCC 38327]|uniref:Uncharacterized protein n=1 Tax=Allomyces macrogynus (strain ATCC 38327) TaxID=578462 RepID=A0A0L0S2U2_ALLM3|nr:hypothetical protein AMAG_02625 [Allomyces macrogynus ATCC 38327]|eukprot:KNE56853.1 hypothetical protein AMAG_02625 [Allomyces macrogynus ATCC 38327]